MGVEERGASSGCVGLCGGGGGVREGETGGEEGGGGCYSLTTKIKSRVLIILGRTFNSWNSNHSV